MAALIIFYDGGCPLCVREMRHLAKLNKRQQLQFENIHEADFAERFPSVDVIQANQILHGQLANGEMLYGLDVTHAAWSAVGRGWLTAPLRWWGIRRIADWIYLWFARHRNQVSKWLTGAERCAQCRIDK